MSSRFGILSLTISALVLLAYAPVQAQQPAPAGTAPAAAAKPAPAPAAAPAKVDPATQFITEAAQKMDANDIDGALAKLTDAIHANPNSSAAYVLRASVYCQKKQWAQAEQDFTTASKLAPTNVIIQFNLMEVKFMQKQYDVARAGYVPFQKDVAMGDFATYKIFLCDLMAGHEDVASKELDAINKIAENPSYYYCNAAWSLYHKKTEDARGWLISASRIYAPRKNSFYLQSLHDLGFLPLPPPPQT